MDKELIDAEAQRLWPAREDGPRENRPVFSLKELDAYSVSAFTMGALWAAKQAERGKA